MVGFGGIERSVLEQVEPSFLEILRGNLEDAFPLGLGQSFILIIETHQLIFMVGIDPLQDLEDEMLHLVHFLALANSGEVTVDPRPQSTSRFWISSWGQSYCTLSTLVEA